MRSPVTGLRHRVRSAALWLGGGDTLLATSVVAPSFPELVAEAESIVRARVVGLRAAWIDSPQRISAELSRRARLP